MGGGMWGVDLGGGWVWVLVWGFDGRGWREGR